MSWTLSSLGVLGDQTTSGEGGVRTGWSTFVTMQAEGFRHKKGGKEQVTCLGRLEDREILKKFPSALQCKYVSLSWRRQFV